MWYSTAPSRVEGAGAGWKARARAMFAGVLALSAALVCLYSNLQPDGAAEVALRLQAARRTQLLQWFGLVQQGLDEGTAPAAGERMAKKMGERSGVIPKGSVIKALGDHDDLRVGFEQQQQREAAERAGRGARIVGGEEMPPMPNPKLSAAANARAFGAALHPLLDEAGAQDYHAEAHRDDGAPLWVREDYGDTTQRHVHRERQADTAEETAAFIEHQRAVAQQRWAMALGLRTDPMSDDENEDTPPRADANFDKGRMPSPLEQQAARTNHQAAPPGVDMRSAPTWVKHDYEGHDTHASAHGAAGSNAGAAFDQAAAESAQPAFARGTKLAVAHTDGSSAPKLVAGSSWTSQQDAAAIADEKALKEDEVRAAELALEKGGDTQALASSPKALHPALTVGALHAAAKGLVRAHAAADRERAAHKAAHELSEFKNESMMWLSHVRDRTRPQPQAALASQTKSPRQSQSVYADATLKDATPVDSGARVSVAARNAGGNGARGVKLASRKIQQFIRQFADPARLEMLSERSSRQVPAVAKAEGKRSLVLGMDSILKNLQQMKAESRGDLAPAEHKGSQQRQPANQQQHQRQQQALLRLAAAMRDKHSEGGSAGSSALLRRLQRQLFAGLAAPAQRAGQSLSSAEALRYQRAGAEAEAAHLQHLVGVARHGSSAVAGGAVGGGGSAARVARVRQQQQEVRLKAIDRLYKKLYGSSGSFEGEHADPVSGSHSVGTGRGEAALSTDEREHHAGGATPVAGRMNHGTRVIPRNSAQRQELKVASRELEHALRGRERFMQLRDSRGQMDGDEGGRSTLEEQLRSSGSQAAAVPGSGEEGAAAGMSAELERAHEEADAPFAGEPYGAPQAVEDEDSAHARMVKRRAFVATELEHMEHSAFRHGIETQNDIDTIHRMQKAYPYSIRDVSQKWAMCARSAADLSAAQRETCADHFVWLMLKRSINQSYCDPRKRKERDCAPSDTVRNPGFDTCLNPMLNDVQVSAETCVHNACV